MKHIEDFKNVLSEQGHKLDPYDYYRKLRPEKFSDSKVNFKMTREVFEFQLNQLSTHMKQDEFEEFTRQLVCRLITPNIIPQTGPTGGGDGKTDLETHTVSEDIAVHWYVPDGGCHGEDKWAMAISCKADWGSKINSDVKKIVETGRGFTKILFFTNQVVSSKQKTNKQEKYKKDYIISVEIYDRNWFVQSVYDNHCYEIAIYTLHLSHDFLQDYKEEGPNDHRKRLALRELDEKINQESNTNGYDTQYVEDLLATAILSREIEDAPVLVRGRFERALRESEKHGMRQQIYEILYQHAWTAFYWFRNPDETFRLYCELKNLLEQDINVVRLEKLLNLYNILFTASHEKLFINPIDFHVEKSYLTELYKQLETDKDHASSFLYLKICLLEFKIIYGKPDLDETDKIIQSLSDAMIEAEHHLDIHFESRLEIIEMLGNCIDDNEYYEDMLDKLSEILIRRNQGIDAANIQLRRGMQNIEKERYVEAIRHLGQCIQPFQKEETRGELIRSCGLLACAYAHMDLLYSAKIFYVKSLSLLFHKIEMTGSIDHLLITILMELCDLELRLGQIANFLLWFELMEIMARSSRDFYTEDYLQKKNRLDAMLAIRLVNSECSLPGFSILPDVLARLELFVSQNVLLHTLGHDDVVGQDFKDILMSENDWDIKMQEQLNSENFLFDTYLATNGHLQMQTVISGCILSITAPADCKIQIYSEILLAYVESLLSTSKWNEVAIATPTIHFEVIETNDQPSCIIPDDIPSNYTFQINLNTINNNEMWDCLSMFLAHFITKNAMTHDIENFLEGKQKNEKVLERLSVMMTHEQCCKNILGDNFKNSGNNWAQLNDKEYTFQGTKIGMTSFEKLKGKQSEVKIYSHIIPALWDKAIWKGCGFLWGNRLEPVGLALCFANIEAGNKIIQGWKKECAEGMLNLRISFIKHVDAKNPFWYKVHIGTDITKLGKETDVDQRYVTTTSRFHKMTPQNSKNLDMFKAYIHNRHECILTAVEISQDNQIVFNGNMPSGIPFSNIVFREAWEIGEGDIDSVVILADDYPLIPTEHQTDAPVLKLLNKKRT
ncbi:MAG: hypothetical protein PHR38_00980 [Bacteroidales bacterium]|nr:hypothetical protein [Bacteroidales bacterium]